MASQLSNKWLVRGVTTLLVVTLWQLVGQSTTKAFFATPVDVAVRLYQITVDGTLPGAVATTLGATVVGFLAGSAVAIPVGLLMGRSRLVEFSLDPIVTFLFSTPIIVIIPIVGIWFGPNLQTTYVIAFIGTLFPILVNTLSGVKDVSRSLLETGRSFGFEGGALWRKVVVPHSVPYIMAGLRLGVGSALVSALLGEIFLYTSALGGLLVQYADSFDTPGEFGVVLVVALMGLALMTGVQLVEKKVSWTGRGTGVI